MHIALLLAGLTSSVVLVVPIGAREPKAVVSPSRAAESAAATFIPWLLQSKDELRELPFREVIFHATGKKVLAINPADETDAHVLRQIGTALDEVLKRMNAPDAAVQSVARIMR